MSANAVKDWSQEGWITPTVFLLFFPSRCTLPVGWNTVGEDAYTFAGHCVDRGAPSEWIICFQQTFPPADGGLCSMLLEKGVLSGIADSNLLHNGQKCLLSICFCILLRGFYLLCKQSHRLWETDHYAWKLPMSLKKKPLFRRVVMTRSPQCISGNTLLLNVSQDKKYMSRTDQQWPWKNIWPKKKIRQVLFLIFNLAICIFCLQQLNYFISSSVDRNIVLLAEQVAKQCFLIWKFRCP